MRTLTSLTRAMLTRCCVLDSLGPLFRAKQQSMCVGCTPDEAVSHSSPLSKMFMFIMLTSRLR